MPTNGVHIETEQKIHSRGYSSRCALRLITCLILCLSPYLWGRPRALPGYEDVPRLVKEAPLIFRGQVVQVDLTRHDQNFKQGIAIISIDRWYKTENPKADFANVSVHFGWSSGQFIQGHDCSDLVLDTYWIFFAKPGGDGEPLELFDDCEGALSISARMAPTFSKDFTAQIEADFRAGLSDSDSAARLASIQRLAALPSPASLEALHDVIAHASEEESHWALFAAVKTGDVSVMPLAIPVLVALRHDKPGPYQQPEGNLALALHELHTEDAVPYLVQIVDRANDQLVRNCAMGSLAELKSAAALESYAGHLTDPLKSIRYYALLGMKYVTQAPACSFTDPQKADANVEQCRQWWQSTGQQEFRSR